MELIGANQQKTDKKTKKTMIIIGVILVTLLIISIVLFVIINYLRQKLFKFNIDGVNISNYSDELFIFDGDTIYVSLKDIASKIGYEYYQGGYKEYTESLNKCYLQSSNEICTFEEDANTIYKTPVSEVDYEYFKIEKPIKMINNKLYITSDGLKIACNLDFYYNKNKNTATIYTLPYYVDYYTKNYKFSALSTSFNNQKALLYGLLITQNVENTEKNNNPFYGISTVEDKEIVGKKYTSIEFIESNQEFIVKTTENKVGIITADGDTKVQPQYDSLKQIDKDLNLYLATNNGKQGVLERNGKILIYLEYDQIGIDAKDFTTDDIKNPYLLFNNAIPVKQNDKWGLYDTKGNNILPIQYDGIGKVSKNGTYNNIAIIPNIKGIVVAQKYALEKNKEITLYGIVNYLGKELVPSALEEVFYTVSNGRREYKMVEYGTDEEINIIQWIGKNKNIDELNEEETSNQKEDENVIVNETIND